MLPLSRPATAAFGLVLGSLAHTAGWLFPRGGAQRLTEALAAHLRACGGRILTGTRRSTRSTRCRKRPRSSASCPRGRSCASPEHRRAPGYRQALQALSLRLRGVQGRLGARRADAVAGPGLPAGRHGASGRDARPKSGSLGGSRHVRTARPSGPFVLLDPADRRRSDARAAGTARRTGGALVTCRTGRPSTCARASRRRWSGSRRAFARAFSPARQRAQPRSRRAIPIWSAATLAPAPVRSGSCSGGRPGANMRPRPAGCICAPLQRPPASACMACAATLRRDACCAIFPGREGRPAGRGPTLACAARTPTPRERQVRVRRGAARPVRSPQETACRACGARPAGPTGRRGPAGRGWPRPRAAVQESSGRTPCAARYGAGCRP